MQSNLGKNVIYTRDIGIIQSIKFQTLELELDFSKIPDLSKANRPT